MTDEQKIETQIYKPPVNYSDIQIVGNLVNTFIKNKQYSDIKTLCSSIKKINHLQDDYRKLISFLEKHKQLSDYLFNFHDKNFDFNKFKKIFRQNNNISENEGRFKIIHPRELTFNNNKQNYRFFVKIVGNTKQLSIILNVKKLQIMWIANTPVWFVPYENLGKVLNTAHGNNIDIKVEKMGMGLDFLFK